MLDSESKDVLLENNFNSRNRYGVAERVVQADNNDDLFDKSLNSYRKFVNKITGEILPFRSPFNVEPDKGVENVHDDECVLSDYVPIKDQIKMFTREDIIRINQLDNMEKELSDLDDDDLDDYVTDDELDTLMNLEEFELPLFKEQGLQQAEVKATTKAQSETKQTDDRSAASGGSAASTNERTSEAQS